MLEVEGGSSEEIEAELITVGGGIDLRRERDPTLEIYLRFKIMLANAA
jgi:hypothetical protein